VPSVAGCCRFLQARSRALSRFLASVAQGLWPWVDTRLSFRSPPGRAFPGL
jgi:hypothetical protein